MAEGEPANEIVKRALAYPFQTPGRSFIQLGARTLEVPAEGPDLRGRAPLLAYGANAAPEALARKLAALPGVPLPVLRGELDDLDVVYSAHVSFHGAVPATLHRSPGTRAPCFLAFATPEQRQLLIATEPNYELTRIGAAHAFVSRHGPLLLDGSPIALAAVASSDRQLPTMAEPEVLELVRARLRPDLTLEEFVLAAVASGGLAPLTGFGGL